MTLKVPPVVKDAENVDDILAFAAAIDDEVPGIFYNAKSGTHPVAAETQVIGPDAFLKVAFVLRTRALHVSLDITKGLDNEVFIAQGGIPPEFRLAPNHNLPEIAAGFRETRTVHWLRFLGTFGGNFFAHLMHVSGEIVHGLKLNAFAAVDGIRGFLDGTPQPFELGLVLLLPSFQKPKPFAHHLAGVAEAARGDSDVDKAVEMFCQVYVTGWHDEIFPY